MIYVKLAHMKSTKYTLCDKLHILLDRNTHENLKAEANEKGLGKSSLIRTLLKERYNQNKNGRDKK